MSEHSTSHTLLPFSNDPGIFLECLAGRAANLYGMLRRRGGGICFYINEGWCTDVTVLTNHAAPTWRHFS